MVGIHCEQVVATGLNHLCAQATLAVQGIPGQHATLPLQLRNYRRRDRQFSLACLARYDQLRQDDTKVMCKGSDGVYGKGRVRGTGQASALGFAIQGDPLTAAGTEFAGHIRVEVGGQCGRERSGIEAPEEVLERGDMGRTTAREPKRVLNRITLRCPPLGNGQQRAVITEQGGNREGEDGGEGVAGTLATTRIRERREGGGDGSQRDS